MHDIFLSYSHNDSTTATTVLNILEQNAIKCWIDYRDAQPGDSFASSIVRAIRDCKFFVVLISTASSESQHVLNEVNSAVKACKTIIPFKIDDSEMSDDLEYYLGKTHWLDALTPPLEQHINMLVKIIRGYEQNRIANSLEKSPISAATQELSATSATAHANNGYRMLKLRDLLALGYTPASIAIQLVENDYITCNGIEQENEGTAEQWEEYLRDDSDTFCYLVDAKNKIVGNWSIVALTDEAFEQAKKGQLLEQDLCLDNTNMLCFPDIYNGYVLAFSILPEHRTMQNYNLIIESFWAQLEEYSENGIFFREWCINVFGREIEALVKRMGFKYVCDNKVYGKIYTCSFIPLPDLPILKKYKKLQENYAKLQ